MEAARGGRGRSGKRNMEREAKTHSTVGTIDPIRKPMAYAAWKVARRTPKKMKNLSVCQGEQEKRGKKRTPANKK